MVSWRNGHGGSCLLGEADNEALGILFCGLFVSLIGWSSVSGFLDKLIVFRGFGLSGKIKPFYLFWRIFRSAFVIYLGSSRFWVFGFDLLMGFCWALQSGKYISPWSVINFFHFSYIFSATKQNFRVLINGLIGLVLLSLGGFSFSDSVCCLLMPVFPLTYGEIAHFPAKVPPIHIPVGSCI